MDALIAELEAAPEGSQELDGKIAETQGWTVEEQSTGDNISEPLEFFDVWTEPVTGIFYDEPPPYSRSLDAAEKLVPAGLQYGVSTYSKEEVLNPGGAQAFVTNMVDNSVYAHADASTPALALCIALLKARQAMKDAP